MKILFFAFEFPPLASPGVRRSQKFAKYLAESDVEPVVITTDLAGFKQAFGDYPVDETLLGDLPSHLEVERIPFVRRRAIRTGRLAEWSRIFFSLVEDIAEQWRPELERALPAIIAKHRPAAIYVSIPPFCMAALGCEIGQKYNLPVILDFRDAWSQWRISPYGSWFHYWLTLRIEGHSLRAAKMLVCTSEQTKADFLYVHPEIPESKLSVIMNGYDEPVDSWALQPTIAGEKFVIGYVGSFYYEPASRAAMMLPWWRKRPNRMIQYAPRQEDWLYRSPLFFFRAVAELFKIHPTLRTMLKIRFAGHKPGWIDSQVAETGLHDVVEFVGRLDHPSVLRFQHACDALLITSSKLIGGKDYSIAGKTFEYFSIRKPIIGFVAEGAQKELLRKSGMSLLCDPDTPRKSADQIAALMEGRVELCPDADFLHRLHRRELSKRLASIIKSAVTSSPSS